MQVNAITKSGTNRLGSVPVQLPRHQASTRRTRLIPPRVVPIKNQQYSTAVGGPIITDKLHYFGNFEYERAPKTSIWNTPYPAFNIELTGKETRKLGGGRLDYQLSQRRA